MIRGIIASCALALTTITHLLHVGLPLFLTIIIWIATLGAIIYGPLAKSVGHPVAIVTTMVVICATAIASWPSIIQALSSLYTSPSSVVKTTVAEDNLVDPSKQSAPPPPADPKKATVDGEFTGERNAPNDAATTEIRQRYLRLKDSKIWFFENSWYPIIENGHFLMYFSCAKSKETPDSRWYIYTYDANVTDRWYLIEHYSDASVSDAIIPATRDARYKVDDKIDWFIPL